jgi:hypothetical protein
MNVPFSDEIMKGLNALECGKKYTLVYYNDFGFLVVVEVKHHSVNFVPQYQNGPLELQLVFVPKGKRKRRSKHLKDISKFAILNGWGLGIDPNAGAVVEGSTTISPLCFDDKVIQLAVEKAQQNLLVSKVA